MPNPDAIEAMARACADDPSARGIAGTGGTVCFDDMDGETQAFWRYIALAALTAAEPFIRAEALEDAAKVAAQQRHQRDARTAHCETLADAYSEGCMDVCDAIRALPAKGDGAGERGER